MADENRQADQQQTPSSGRYYQPAFQPGQEEQSPYTQPGQKPKLGIPPRFPIIPVFVVLIAAVAILTFVVGSGYSCSQKQHYAEKYGASAPYTVTGTVEKATEKASIYYVEIETDQKLPDGSYKFVSDASRDYSHAKKHVGEAVEVTIGTDGHIEDVKVLEDYDPVDDGVSAKDYEKWLLS